MSTVHIANACSQCCLILAQKILGYIITTLLARASGKSGINLKNRLCAAFYFSNASLDAEDSQLWYTDLTVRTAPLSHQSNQWHLRFYLRQIAVHIVLL